ncbi:MAG: DUF4178 domain-containing protein [Pseudomonadota bacterium]
MLDVATQKSFQERLTAIRTLEKQDLVSSKEQTGATLQDAGPSAFFEYSGQTYFVQDLNKYEETSDDYKKPQGYFIYELTCLCLETGKTTHFEWEFDDELEVSMTLERLSFRNLKDDEGVQIDEDDLDQIADDKDVIVINGEKFWYEDDWASIYHRGDKKERVYMYEFETQSHAKFLTIEEWSGSGKDEYQIYTSIPVNPAGIILVSKGDPQG